MLLEVRENHFLSHKTKLQDKIKVRGHQVKVRGRPVKVKVKVTEELKISFNDKIKGHFRNQKTVVADVAIGMEEITVLLKIKLAKTVVEQITSQNAVELQ